MAIKYKEQKKNNKLMAFVEKPKTCRVCNNILTSSVTIAYQGGDTSLCYACNIKMGLLE